MPKTVQYLVFMLGLYLMLFCAKLRFYCVLFQLTNVEQLSVHVIEWGHQLVCIVRCQYSKCHGTVHDPNIFSFVHSASSYCSSKSYLDCGCTSLVMMRTRRSAVKASPKCEKPSHTV